MKPADRSDSDRAFNVFRFDRAMRHVGRLESGACADVTTLAAHAVMTGDKFLAAAIMARLGAMSKRERWLAVVLRRELERVILDRDAGRAWEAIAVARERARSASFAGPATPLPRIGMPIRRQ